MAKKKFATTISAEAMAELKSYSQEAKRSISDIVDDALKSHLRMVRVRPVFRSAVDEVLFEHNEALRRLAK
jgi:hypothetical protein